MIGKLVIKYNKIKSILANYLPKIKLKLCQMPYSHKSIQKIKFEGFCGKLETKTFFRGNHSENI